MQYLASDTVSSIAATLLLKEVSENKCILDSYSRNADVARAFLDLSIF